MIIISIIFLLFFLVAPIRTRMVLFVINLFLPDPIPYVDEFIMGSNILMYLGRGVKIIKFIKDNMALSIFGGICIILIFIFIV